MPIYGAIEAGGTKFVCGVGNSTAGSLETATIPTRDPDTTFAELALFFANAARHGELAGIGIATFGPVDLSPASAERGTILRTPKPGWEGTNLLARVRAIADVPIGIDTDVNAAALAEARAAGNLAHLAYVTVGTGIGVGLVSAGQTVHGFTHPEMGHVIPRRHPLHGDYPGGCPFHGDCIEGLASGPAMAAAWGRPAPDLPAGHPAWEVEASYLAQLCVTLFLGLSPERIVLGGGVMEQGHLLPRIRAETKRLLGGYIDQPENDWLERRICPPSCAEPPGLVGAYILAERAAA